jgi:hypothetical protein
LEEPVHLAPKVLLFSFLALVPSVTATVSSLNAWEARAAQSAADAAASRYGYATLYDNVSGLSARP